MPPSILDPQIELMRWIAEYRTPLLNWIFLAISGSGSALGYTVLLSIVWWGSSWKIGARIFVALVLSIYVNALIKDAIAQPRPFVYADFESVTRPDEFSLPSGHSQHAALVWTLLAVQFRKRWLTALAAAMVLLIGFSRVQLGVHFPSDVVAGWLLGGLLALTYLKWSPRVEEWADGLVLRSQLALALTGPALLTLAHDTRYTAMSMGGLAGALVGLAMARSQHLYPPEEGADKKGSRVMVGLIGLPLLYLGLLALSPEEGSELQNLSVWLRFAAVGLWVSFLVPRIVASHRRRRS